MKLLDKLRSTTGTPRIGPTFPHSPSPSHPPAWHTSLASLGWSSQTLTTISTIRSTRGAGFLGSTYPNVLVVLKAGPTHPGARKVVGILERIVTSTGGASPTGQAGTQEGGQRCHRSQWKTLADYDDAQQLRAKLNKLLHDPRFHVAHYSATYVNAFNASWKSGNIEKLRKAYYEVLEKWVMLRRLGYG